MSRYIEWLRQLVLLLVGSVFIVGIAVPIRTLSIAAASSMVVITAAYFGAVILVLRMIFPAKDKTVSQTRPAGAAVNKTAGDLRFRQWRLFGVLATSGSLALIVLTFIFKAFTGAPAPSGTFFLAFLSLAAGVTTLIGLAVQTLFAK